MISVAGKINDEQPGKVVNRAFKIMNDQRKVQVVKNSPMPLIGQKGGVSSFESNGHKKRVLLIGLAYKPDIDDVRESAALKIWDIFEKAGYEVWYHDPFVPTIRDTQSKALSDSVVKLTNMIIIVTNHSKIDYDKLSNFGIPILDTRNVYANGSRKQHIYRL
jgi:UDP-N-acetyl-D-glucosamine dehydrogenase